MFSIEINDFNYLQVVASEKNDYGVAYSNEYHVSLYIYRPLSVAVINTT